jgi:superfamily II helicase
MSLHEPQRPTPNDYVQQILAQFQRAVAVTGRPSASFVTVCDRASIPRDLRKQLLDELVTGQYVTREGDEVQLTKAGQQLVATLPNPSPADNTTRGYHYSVRGSGSGH